MWRWSSCVPTSRARRLPAGGFHSRTIEVLDQRGGRRSLPRGGSGGSGPDVRLDRVGHERLSDASSVHAGDLQNKIERIMTWIAELPVRIDYGCGGDGLRAGQHRRRRRPVGRRLAASAAPSSDATEEEAPSGEQPASSSPAGSDEEQPDRRGRDDRIAAAGRSSRCHRRPRPRQAGGREDGTGRHDRAGDRAEQRADPARSSEALISVYGTDFGIHNPTWIASRFTDMTRQAMRGAEPPRRSSEGPRIILGERPSGTRGPSARTASMSRSMVERALSGDRDR